jgi:acetyltransferase-like isoleucine patch superfamily enzyme
MMSVHIDVVELNKGENVKIEDGVTLRGDKFSIGENTIIKKGTFIEVSESFSIGKNSIIGENNIIRGRKININREFYSNHNSEIGGGSCFEKTSQLSIGYWFHIGSYSIINTAAKVTIGNSVGLGRFTNIYTHGAYLSIFDGYPVSFAEVSIGDNVWIPGATLNPGVKIGSNVVIGVGSIVLKDIPSNCMAVGSPCKIIKENAYPNPLSIDKKIEIIDKIQKMWDLDLKIDASGIFKIDKACINLIDHSFSGKVSPKSERCRNLLRRWGIRFKVDCIDGEYHPWQ